MTEATTGAKCSQCGQDWFQGHVCTPGVNPLHPAPMPLYHLPLKGSDSDRHHAHLLKVIYEFEKALSSRLEALDKRLDRLDSLVVRYADALAVRTAEDTARLEAKLDKIIDTQLGVM